MLERLHDVMRKPPAIRLTIMGTGIFFVGLSAKNIPGPLTPSVSIPAAQQTRATVRIDILPDRRCSVAAEGEGFRSNMTYRPTTEAASGEFRCAMPPVPGGRPIDLTVALAPGSRPWGNGSPRLDWTEKEGRWVGHAVLTSRPEIVVVGDAAGPKARRQRILRLIAALLATAAAVVALVSRRRRLRRAP